MGKRQAAHQDFFAKSAERGSVQADQPFHDHVEAQPYLYAPLDNPPMLGLPSSHNWCNLGGCTPIRNQGSCGSCWAFGTVGPLEATIKMWDAQARDLAEQYLVSCASEYNGCGGGWFAHDYHEWKIPAGETTAGAVYEADFAYQARDSSQGVGCDFTPQPHTHHEKIASWAEIDPYYNVPSVSAIKQAIYEHGPVAAAVCVGSAFQGYRNGVFQTNETCSNDVNHAIVLVGWNDAEQTWILRNSWGTGWGESGYMRIKWGTSKIGYGANYIVYGVPSNLAASARSNWINLMWTDNTLAENGFKVERSPGDTSNWMQIAAVLADTVAYTDTDVTCNTVYYYRVRAYTSVADSPYSSIANATACASAPTAPGNFCAAAASATRINLTWVDNSSVETGFKIERSPDGTHDWTQIATVGANVTDYSNTGLTCDTIYYYRIRAYNAGGDSGYSNTANAMTLGCSSCADSYETDDDSLSARPITVTDAAQTHNFHVAGDVDWVKFTATEDQTYSAMTSNLDNGNDTVLELYSTDGTTMLAWNDECPGMQAASCINDWTAPGSGVYYIKVREHRSDRGGCTGYDYDVGVSGSRIRVYLPLVTRSKTAR